MPPFPPDLSDRRRHHREPTSRPCKIFHWPSQRYYPGQICDLSPGGALVRIDAPRSFAVEDPVDLLIAWEGEAVLSSNSQARSTIVRAQSTYDRGQIVALEFEKLMPARARAA
jgi:hypothetical protein